MGESRGTGAPVIAITASPMSGCLHVENIRRAEETVSSGLFPRVCRYSSLCNFATWHLSVKSAVRLCSREVAKTQSLAKQDTAVSSAQTNSLRYKKKAPTVATI